MLTKRSRRWSEQARDQNWFGIIIDLVIVVAGVFLAIQAANWNDARKERAEERRYYAQIIADLRVDQATLHDALRRSNALDAAAENTLRAMREGILPGVSPEHFARDIHYAGYLYIPPTVRRSYDELISTGNLGLLQSEQAKASIASYYSRFDELRQWDELMRSQQGRYWAATSGVLPRPILRDLLEERAIKISDAEAGAILAELRSRDQVDDMLVGMAAHQARVRRDSVDLAERGQALMKELAPLASR
ncbi:DUF6090 family protein [Sphingomonas sp. NSE70-1]|uniref:DUF6090 family protein n=1 Tax=Sphingomonas caseinilyticus TaxID=2908205 RepID=A0ABT0RXV4_9SPHN|nr:DUF6090 family protein [Sphingomonas caseinilyticus]MCL6699852.1 DUF6090 family protein [Sphingomonas caseinilyticus]